MSLVDGYPRVTQETEQIWTRPSVLLACASLVLHALANGHYGFLRDELYFIVCGAAQRNPILAMKALSHKIARACYYLMRDQVVFEPDRLFG